MDELIEVTFRDRVSRQDDYESAVLRASVSANSTPRSLLQDLVRRAFISRPGLGFDYEILVVRDPKTVSALQSNLALKEQGVGDGASLLIVPSFAGAGPYVDVFISISEAIGTSAIGSIAYDGLKKIVSSYRRRRGERPLGQPENETETGELLKEDEAIGIAVEVIRATGKTLDPMNISINADLGPYLAWEVVIKYSGCTHIVHIPPGELESTSVQIRTFGMDSNRPDPLV
jgi:hypothetical protein